MKIYTSNIYGKINQPENFEELIKLLLTFDNTGTDKVHMWRGQSNIEWRLDHSAFRRLQIEKSKVSESDLLYYEKKLLEQATHKGYRIQDGRLLSDFELLARLQHHGAATRLLDFTRNALVALWFCVAENQDKTGLLIGLHTDYLGGNESEVEETKYEIEVKNIKDIKHPMTWEPPLVTPRIAAQHSQFIYSALSDDKRSSVRLYDSSNANIFIAISYELKATLEDILEKTFDLRYYTLFPDIDGFGRANGHNVLPAKMWRW